VLDDSSYSDDALGDSGLRKLGLALAQALLNGSRTTMPLILTNDVAYWVPVAVQAPVVRTGVDCDVLADSSSDNCSRLLTVGVDTRRWTTGCHQEMTCKGR
jgi:hypothetical protein